MAWGLDGWDLYADRAWGLDGWVREQYNYILIIKFKRNLLLRSDDSTLDP